MTLPEGVWLLPTRRRPAQLQRFFDQAIATGLSTQGWVLVQEEEYLELQSVYDTLPLAPGWGVVPVKAEGMAAKVQDGYRRACKASDKLQWIGVLTDDQWPLSQAWDAELIRRVNGWNIVTSDDLDQAPKRMEGATVFSKGLLDAIGYMAPHGLHHLFFDDVFERLHERTGIIQWAMDVKVRHTPIGYAGKRDSTSDKVRSFRDSDEATFRKWIEDDYSNAVGRIIAHMERCGVKIERPDLSDVSLYLATPDGDGTLDRVYVRSLIQTIDTVRQAGGKIDWAEMPYVADLSHARARILGAFLKSQHTHLLMVDSDIGWNPQDVLRLLSSGLDVVGGAGPKKNYPLRYCIQSRDDDGNPVPGVVHIGTGGIQLVEVTGIGTGFLLVSRACCQRMVEAYPELVFDPGEGSTENGLFDPVYVNKARFSDDFAFCWRWRRIGGKVYAMPSIKLKHVGAHCFEGALIDAMMADPQPMAAE